MKIILASKSESRKKALDILGLDYEVRPAEIDEKSIRHPDPKVMARKLAEAKAMALRGENAIVIAGDLFVVFNNKVIEKPKTIAEAKEMLKQFSGNKLQIITGLAVLSKKRLKSTATVCDVRFREISDEEINDYCKNYPVLKFAGAFDGDGMLLFAEHISGSLNFITAFPMDKLIEFLEECK